MCDGHDDGLHAVAQVAPRRTHQDAEETTDRVFLEPVDAVTVTVLVDNVADMLLLDQGPAKRVNLGGGKMPMLPVATSLEGSGVDALRAEHGLSFLLTVERGDRVRRFLFDTGVTPDGMIENMRRLDLDPADVDVIVLSHGHFDHVTGLDGFIRAVGRPNLPVIVHPDLWLQRRIAIPGRDPFEMPTPSLRALEDAGFEIIERRRPSLLFEESVLVTGEVDRTTSFEQGFLLHQALRDGEWQPDPLILDDQAMILHVRGKGLVVLTGCGHAGIVNIARYAQRLTGVEEIYALIGGFHLSGPLFEPVIAPTCAAIAELDPTVIVPAHCTGWRATHAVAARFPDAFIANSVGTRFALCAD